MKTFGFLNATAGQYVWAVLALIVFTVQMLGVFGVWIFEPLSRGMMKNIAERGWVRLSVYLFFVWWIGHWFRIWPWEDGWRMNT